MAEFGSLLEFGAHLAAMAVNVERSAHEGMERAAQIVETEAKRVLGTHDYGWAPLKPETIAHKKTGDSPLLETGEMRDSIGHHVHGHIGLAGTIEAEIGSNDDKAIWHELGTSKMPPRPFLLGAAVHKEREIVEIIGHECVKGITHR